MLEKSEAEEMQSETWKPKTFVLVYEIIRYFIILFKKMIKSMKF